MFAISQIMIFQSSLENVYDLPPKFFRSSLAQNDSFVIYIGLRTNNIYTLD